MRLEATALDVGTKNMLDALLAAYARRVPGVNIHIVKGITMVSPALPPELLGQA